jgi:phospholipid/cholesterol/gamma-HCH transport system substrate-binding protein
LATRVRSGREKRQRKMFKGNKNFAVGLFVSIAMAAFISFVLWLTGRSGVEEMTRYSMMFERDVSGLAIGGPVKYMGVSIGSVIQMEIIGEGNIRVRVDIEVLEDTPINSGTFASLAFQGITGVAVVNLDSDAGIHEQLGPTPGVQYPVIPVRDVGFAALLSSAPKIMERLDELLSQANLLLGESNRDSIARSLGNVETLTGSLADSREMIATLPADLNRTLTDVQALIGQVQELVSQASPDITSTLGNLNDSSESLSSLTANLDNWLKDNEANLNRFVDDGLGEVPALVSGARQTLRELEKLLAALQDDLSQLIHRPREDSLEIEP